MIIPFNTDAPLYHRPIGTIALIVVNVVVFAATFAPDELDVEHTLSLLLHHDEIAPQQWVTSIFMHGSIGHLVGNMLFLWAFGLVVEGKLGWWKFLLVYLAIGVGECAVEQTIGYLATDGEGVSLGASSAIYGLMLMALVWAPKNEINCVLVYSFWGVWFFDVPITLVAGLYVGLDLLLAFGDGFGLTTPVFHLLGGAIGAIIGLTLFKSRLVDCEGWDIFSIIAGREGEARRQEPAVESAASDEEGKQRAALLHLRDHLKANDLEAAYALHQRMAAKSPGWKLTEPMQKRLIALLLAAKEFGKARLLLADSIRRFPAASGPLRLALAEIALRQEGRPGQALTVLAQIDPGSLPPELERRRHALEQEAAARKTAGELEMQPEDL